MNESKNASSQSSVNSKMLIAFLWIVSVVLIGTVGYGYGQSSVTSQPKTEEKVLNAQTNQPASLQDPRSASDKAAVAESVTLPASNTAVGPASSGNTSACTKTGFAQKWEYLTAYVIRASDTLQTIATEQLKDATRVNELLQINGVGPLVVGSTLYLPPPSITKSSGKIQQVYGKLVEKNDTSWHVSFTGDKSGQGILIPSFLFQDVPNKDSFEIGNCVTVLLDDGYKVYSLSLQ
jgi:hypothetical protein